MAGLYRGESPSSNVRACRPSSDSDFSILTENSVSYDDDSHVNYQEDGHPIDSKIEIANHAPYPKVIFEFLFLWFSGLSILIHLFGHVSEAYPCLNIR